MRCLAFDLGKVIFDFDFGIALDKIKDALGVPAETVISELLQNNFASDFEKGLVSNHDFYTHFTKTFGIPLNYEEFVDIWCDIFTLKQETIDLIERLRVIYPVYLISNINRLHFEHLKRIYPQVFSLFDELILSFEVRSIKPEATIYDELKKVAGVEYEDLVYIDDRRDLIEEAIKLNMTCIQYTDFDAVIKELTDAGIVIPSRLEADLFAGLKNKLTTSKNPLIMGIGNTLKGDDGVGVKIVDAIKGKMQIETINAGVTPENYLGIVEKNKHDFLLLIDAAHIDDMTSFKLLSPNQIQTISLFFTHDASLNLTMHYLQNQGLSDIVLLAIKTHSQALTEVLSEPVNRTKTMCENFFIRNFSAANTFSGEQNER